MRKARIVFILALTVFIVALGPVYASNLSWFFSTTSRASLIQGNWPVAALYILVFSTFLFFLVKHPLSRNSWKKESGVYAAFIIALFAEMFGFPLTIYLMSAMGTPSATPVYSPPIAFSFSVFGVNYDLLVTSLVAGLVSLAAFFIVLVSWRQVFSSKGLETKGMYGIVRHPQYSAIMATVVIWAVAWPTLLTLLLCPILLYAYYRLSLSEEKELEKAFPAYKEYKKRVPMLVP